MKTLFVLLVIAGLAVFVWPTRYQHFGPGENPHDVQLLPNESSRVDRLTGDIEVALDSGEWKTIGNARKALAFQNPDANPNAVHQPAARTYDNSKVDQQQRSVEKTQEAVNAATKQAGR